MHLFASSLIIGMQKLWLEMKSNRIQTWMCVENDKAKEQRTWVTVDCDTFLPDVEFICLIMKLLFFFKITAILDYLSHTAETNLN